MKQEIKSYKIIAGGSLRDVQESVVLYIKEGWKPQGGVTCSMEENETQWAQAMIKKG